MVDRIPLFPNDGTYPGYTATQPEVLTAEQYQAGPVNYFAQVLGPQTASLREETGVGVTKAPEVGREETREDDPSPKAPSAILAATRPTLDGDISASGEISFDIPAANPGGGSYSKFLSDKGMNDRIPLVKIYEGMAYDDKEVNLFENIGAAVKEGGKKVADPKKAVGSIFKTVKNAFNNDSFRGFGVAGAFADMVHSIQYRDLDLIRAARTAGVADTGFAMTLGDYGITRAPGSSTYTGNTRGMDIETIVALEAISKGYDPTQGRYNMRDPSKSQTVTRSGGIQVSDNPMDGFIRANGTVYDPRFIGAGASGTYARTDMIEKAATYYGVTPDQMSGALAVARSGTMNVRQALNKVLEPKYKAFQEKASQEMKAYKTSASERYVDRLLYGVDQGTDDTEDLQAGREDRERERVERTVADIQDKGRRETFATGFADGGRVGLAMGGAPSMASGFVERPPDQVPEDQTVADDKKAQLPEGAFVINAAAAEFMGTDDVRKMLLDAHREALRQGLVVDKQGNGAKLIDVAISRGEVVVAPHLAKIIGYDRLTKINNRGKPETRERIQENGQQPVPVAQGGFLGQKGYAEGDKITVYRGEPLDPSKVVPTDYGYGKEDVGKFHTPDVQRAQRFAAGAGKGNQVIKSRKVTIEELFDGIEEAWKINAKKKNEYFEKIGKRELNNNLRYVRNLKKAYLAGERSLESMAMFLQEQVFHDDKSKINFIETFKNDPKSAGNLVGRGLAKIATKATPPMAILGVAAEIFTPSKLGKGTLYDDSFMTYQSTKE